MKGILSRVLYGLYTCTEKSSGRVVLARSEKETAGLGRSVLGGGQSAFQERVLIELLIDPSLSNKALQKKLAESYPQAGGRAAAEALAGLRKKGLRIEELKWVAYTPPQPGLVKALVFFKARSSVQGEADTLVTGFADTLTGSAWHMSADPMKPVVRWDSWKRQTKQEADDVVVVTNVNVLTGGGLVADGIVEVFGFGDAPHHAVAGWVMRELRDHPAIEETTTTFVFQEGMWKRGGGDKGLDHERLDHLPRVQRRVIIELLLDSTQTVEQLQKKLVSTHGKHRSSKKLATSEGKHASGVRHKAAGDALATLRKDQLVRDVRWIAYDPPKEGMVKAVVFFKARSERNAQKDMAYFANRLSGTAWYINSSPTIDPVGWKVGAGAGRHEEEHKHDDVVVITNVTILSGGGLVADGIIEVYGLGKTPYHAISSWVIHCLRLEPEIGETTTTYVFHEGLWAESVPTMGQQVFEFSTKPST